MPGIQDQFWPCSCDCNFTKQDPVGSQSLCQRSYRLSALKLMLSRPLEIQGQFRQLTTREDTAPPSNKLQKSLPSTALCIAPTKRHRAITDLILFISLKDIKASLGLVCYTVVTQRSSPKTALHIRTTLLSRG